MSEKVYEGTVIWFDNRKGFGFISWENQKDMFCHFSDIEASGYRTLKKDQKVQFSIGTNNRGEPKATNIKVLGG